MDAPPTDSPSQIVDLSDQQLRRRGGLKWSYPPADVLPAWVAEVDIAPATVISQSVAEAVALGGFGYPDLNGGGVPEALHAFAQAHYGWSINPDWVVLTGDVLAGISLALNELCEPAPVIVPTPAYHPFLAAIGLTGRKLIPIELDPNGPAELDLDRYEQALRAGARTILITQPHNPWGRVFRRTELEPLIALAERFGARIISDEIHGPLALAGASHLPLASLPGARDIVITVLSATKAWNIPALPCGQIICGNAADAARLKAVPLAGNHGLTRLGQIATVAAYTHGRPWLAAWVQRLGQIRDRFTSGLATALPQARMRTLEGTYLAWLDVRECQPRGARLTDPARELLTRGKLMVNDGRTFGPGGQGHIRVNLGTSVERTDRILHALAEGLG